MPPLPGKPGEVDLQEELLDEPPAGEAEAVDAEEVRDLAVEAEVREHRGPPALQLHQRRLVVKLMVVNFILVEVVEFVVLVVEVEASPLPAWP